MEKLLAELREKFEVTEDGDIHQVITTDDKMLPLVDLVNRHLGQTLAVFPPYFWSVGSKPVVLLAQEGTKITLTII